MTTERYNTHCGLISIITHVTDIVKPIELKDIYYQQITY